MIFDAESTPTVVKLANTWVIINVGGGPTHDKPAVTLESPADPARVNAFMNIRVAGIAATYAEWSKRGAEFLTEPLDNRGIELRCYLRVPDGRLIEVGSRWPHGAREGASSRRLSEGRGSWLANSAHRSKVVS